MNEKNIYAVAKKGKNFLYVECVSEEEAAVTAAEANARGGKSYSAYATAEEPFGVVAYFDSPEEFLVAAEIAFKPGAIVSASSKDAAVVMRSDDRNGMEKALKAVGQSLKGKAKTARYDAFQGRWMKRQTLVMTDDPERFREACESCFSKAKPVASTKYRGKKDTANNPGSVSFSFGGKTWAAPAKTREDRYVVKAFGRWATAKHGVKMSESPNLPDAGKAGTTVVATPYCALVAAKGAALGREA